MAAPRPDGGGPRPSVSIISWEPCHVGALTGHLTASVGCYVFHRLPVLRQVNERWLAFPNRPKLASGKATRAKTGGYVTEPIIDIPNPDAKARFDALVLAALDSYLQKGNS